MNSNRHPISQQLSGLTTKLLKYKQKKLIDIPLRKLTVSSEAKGESEALDNVKVDLKRSIQEKGDDSSCMSSYSVATSDNGEEVDENIQSFINNEYKKIRSQHNINKEVEFIVFQPLIDPYTGLEGL